ncbi:hypothetical protein C2E23DRAFT_857132 [Lenzites betulinus]|nr:hypothetical protein C2E23DRAFT_857132 [Lenzites betulinus]
MPFQSRPASFTALDRFDNGASLLSPPLEYHDLFRFAHELSRHLVTTNVTDQQNRQLLLADPFASEQLTRLLHDLLLRIAAASYGGVLDADLEEVPIFRIESLNELGLVVPPILHFLHRFGGRVPFDRPLPEWEFRFWTDSLALAVADTREWLSTAQRRTQLLGRNTSWRWDVADSLPSDLQVRAPSSASIFVLITLLQVGPTPRLVWPVSNDPELVGAAVIRQPLQTDPSTGPTVASLLAAISPPTSTALIPHPIYDPGAHNALTRYEPRDQTRDPRLCSRPSTSQALIPHPLYGPGAQNALVRYRSPTPWHNSRDDASSVPDSPFLISTPPPSYSSGVTVASSEDDLTWGDSDSEASMENLDDVFDDSGEDDECIVVKPGDEAQWPIVIGSDSDDEE